MPTRVSYNQLSEPLPNVLSVTGAAAQHQPRSTISFLKLG